VQIWLDFIQTNIQVISFLRSFYSNFFQKDHFLNSCKEILKLEASSNPNTIILSGHPCKIGTFPIGIDYDRFASGCKNELVQNRILELKNRYKGKKIIIGIDRLDYIKGMPNRLFAFEAFLSAHPEWIEKVVLIQVAVPSRTSVPQYRKLTCEVNQLVGKINGRFGSIDSCPVQFLYRSINFPELCAVYSVADVCIISSLRDGMNLVSHEFVACQAQNDQNGVLILSEFAGAAQTMPNALKINPWDVEQFSQMIFKALTLSSAEKKYRQNRLAEYVSFNTASFWGKSFVKSLIKSIDREESEHNGIDLDLFSESKDEETQ
jgi:trehalose-6-phosphate synthase